MNIPGVSSTWGIASRIVEVAQRHAGREALTVNGQSWAYWELLCAASFLGTALPSATAGSMAPATAVMADRQPSSYVGILAALLRGHTYVPINVNHPVSRNAQALRRSGARQVICGQGALPHLREIFEAQPDLRDRVRVIQCPDEKSGFPLRFGGGAEFAAVPTDALAYILFTSGSTGEPKGVGVSHGNLTGYLDAVRSIMDLSSQDRCSQTFELTFDLSVHDLLVTWTHGAHLIVPQSCDLASPADFIRDERITCWFSVPTLAYQMQLQGRLNGGEFPALRWSIFCGEALPLALAHRWAAAAPGSRVENWYGPTEATIACARFNLADGVDAKTAPNDLTPIGRAFPGMTLMVAGDDLKELPVGEVGELLLSGRQVANGYLNDPERNARSFVTSNELPEVHYRTGDRAVADAAGNIWFLGRVDDQVKIRGFRVELGAIETVVRRAAPGINAVALSWPPGAVSGATVVVALEAATADHRAILELARKELPDYMVPSRIACIPRFPTNASGKADRKAIAAQLKAQLDQEHAGESMAGLDMTQQRLMRTILGLNPHLDKQTLLQAENLLAAGMDSLGFVMLTAEIEQQYGIHLSQELVLELAEKSFTGMVELVEAYIASDGTVAAAPLKQPLLSTASAPQITSRANRVLQFIERFPAVVEPAPKPLVLAIGSSGVFRGFDPAVFDAAALSAGQEFRSFNAGLPAIDGKGIARVCRFIEQQCKARGVKLPLVIYELDPMLVSTIPPTGDLELTEDHFNGKVKSDATELISDDFCWALAAAGAPKAQPAPPADRAQPDWQRARELEIVRTFLGGVEFSAQAADWWLEGAELLGSVSDRVVGFVHPIRKDRMQAVSGKDLGNRWQKIYADLKEKSGILFLDWQDYQLKEADFIDVNHVNSFAGRQKLTEQLAQFCLAAQGKSRRSK